MTSPCDTQRRDGVPPPCAAFGMLPEEDQVELLDYVVVVVRRRWLILCGTVLCMLGVYAYTRAQPVMYRAEAQILAAAELDYLALSAGQGQAARPPSLSLDVLKSFDLSRRVIEQQYEYLLDGQPRKTDLMGYLGARSMEEALPALDGMVTFKSERTGVITIDVETRSPQLSAAVAGQYAEQLVAYNAAKRRRQIDEQLAFINDRMKEVQQELSQAEEAQTEFELRNRNVAYSLERGFLSPEVRAEYGRLQRQVQIRSSLLSTIMNQYEIARVEVEKKTPGIDVLRSPLVPRTGTRMATSKALALGGTSGLLVSLFAAFVLEYVARQRQAGKLEPILAEFRSTQRGGAASEHESTVGR
ncbi:MAG: Wzz/FepE/Etk N-terminal domain-containing protein [Candidatus Latescibacterota bacterium]